MKAYIVIDLGFGDSGKGITVDYLASQHTKNSLVIRYGGGHQSGHRVCLDKFSHVFSQFGAGTLRGVPTWLSSNCTVFPPSLLLEYDAISEYKPLLLIDPLTMITTPYDIAWNHAIESVNKHGSCGVGFGTTIERNNNGVRLYAKDIEFKWVFVEKLKAIRYYYDELSKSNGNPVINRYWQKESADINEEVFIRKTIDSFKLFTIKTFYEAIKGMEVLIFEGHQGIMLDQDHGIYPHVTWSSTVSNECFNLLNKINYNPIKSIDLYFVTRCFQTRHGNGPMSSSAMVKTILPETEHNSTNDFQGDFRTASIDNDLLRYAIMTDRVSAGEYRFNLRDKICEHLIVTCLDRVPDFDIQSFIDFFKNEFNTITGSYSPFSHDFKLLFKRNRNVL